MFMRVKLTCSLGFGYHPENLRKLGVPGTVRDQDIVRGTVIGLAAGELEAVKRCLSPVRLLCEPSWTILQFLRETNIVHG